MQDAAGMQHMGISPRPGSLMHGREEDVMEVKDWFLKKNCLGCPWALSKCLPLLITLPDGPRSCPRELVAIYVKVYLGAG